MGGCRLYRRCCRRPRRRRRRRLLLRQGRGRSRFSISASPSRRPCYHRRRRHRKYNPPSGQRRYRCKQKSFLMVARSAAGSGSCDDRRCHCRSSTAMTKRSGFLLAVAVAVAAVGRARRRRSHYCLAVAGRPGRSGFAPEPTGSCCWRSAASGGGGGSRKRTGTGRSLPQRRLPALVPGRPP
ncbi:unnamed protein product, partial [Ectocarpus fasciculatus]